MPANNLPVQLSSFIGRENERAELKRLLATTRLLTLTGSGGTGKTRLALQVAAEVLDSPSAGSGLAFKDGVWLIELAPISDPALVPAAIASALGIREESDRPLMATLLDWLRPKQLLLILDNCEHLIEACAISADALLHASRETRILATSRQPLGIDGESVWRVPSLPTPNPTEPLTIEQLEQYAAARLFIERATQALATFRVTNANAPAIAQVCHRLDGIPLAIELAAARVKALSVEKIAERLDDRFRLLTGGSRTALPRQQTLRGMIDWSHDLLTEPERILLRRLSVFAGGSTLEAAEEVTSGNPAIEARRAGEQGTSDISPTASNLPLADVLDLLTNLVDKSLVIVDEQAAEPRYHMLETIRQYARERLLDSGESERLRNHQLAFYLQMAEQAEFQNQNARPADLQARLDAEWDNFRVALEWACEHDHEAARRLVGLLRWFWNGATQVNERRAWYARVLALDGGPVRTPGMAIALLGAGSMAGFSTQLDEARSLLEQSMELCRELGDQTMLTEALQTLAYLLINSGHAAGACELYEANETLFRESASPFRLGAALTYWGRALYDVRRDYPAAMVLHAESMAIGRALNHPYLLGVINMNLGLLAEQQGDYEAARRYHMESLAWRRKVGILGAIVVGLRDVARMMIVQGDYLGARSYLDEALVLSHAIRSQRDLAIGLIGYSDLLCREGQAQVSVQLLGSVAAFLQSNKGGLPHRYHMAYERIVAAARTQLGEDAFATAWEAGRRLTLEQTVEEVKQFTTSVRPVDAPPPMQAPSALDPAGLTPREVEVLRLVAQGLTNAQIAEHLVLSLRTVHAHMRSIFSKLDVTTRTAAARVAIEYKLV